MALPVKDFHGTINGKNSLDYLKNLDYSLQTGKKRVKFIKKLIEKDEFFPEYFDIWHKVHPNKGDFLSGDRNVCKAIEKLADYILFSPKDKPKEKNEYKFYTDGKLFERMNKELSVENLANENNNFEGIMHILLEKGKNYKREAKQKIKNKDYTDHDLDSQITYYKITNKELLEQIGNPENDYNELDIESNLNYVRTETVNLLEEFQNIIDFYSMDNIAEKDYNNKSKYKIKELRRESKYNALMIKDKIKGTIYFNHCSSGSAKPDLHLTNYTDPNQIMAILKSTNTNLLTDMGVVTYDIQQLVDKLKLDDFERKVLMNWKNDKLTQEDIAEKLGVNQSFVSQTLTKICNRIVKQYRNEYEDWLYLNYIKGEYKKCSACGDVKLVQKFGKDDRNTDNLKSICKKCD